MGGSAKFESRGRVRQRAIDYKRGCRMENGGNEIDEDSGFFLLLLYDEGQLELKESPSFLSFRPDKRSSFPDHQGSLRPRRDSLKEGSFPFSFPESRSPTAATHCSFPLKPVAPVLRPLYPTPLTLSFRTHVSFYPPPSLLRVESSIKDTAFIVPSCINHTEVELRFLWWPIIGEIVQDLLYLLHGWG